ncbi:MAG: hypothetical protein ACFB0E_02935 [Leptolyngbyaceae cyanobacterium]
MNLRRTVPDAQVKIPIAIPLLAEPALQGAAMLMAELLPGKCLCLLLLRQRPLVDDR